MNFIRKWQSQIHEKYKQIENQEHHLQYLFLELTQRCNLNCLHCGSDCKMSANQPELTTYSWLKIIDYMASNYGRALSFVITGGEPLLHKDLMKIGKHISVHNMRWGMVTNGILLTKEKMNQLEKSGIHSLTLSVDGLEKSHNYLRNSPNAFSHVNRALDVLGESSLKYKDAVTCVYPSNIKELAELSKLLLEKGINSWRLFRIFPSGRAKSNKFLNLSFSQTQELLDWISENKKPLLKKGLDLNLSCEAYLPFDRDIQVRNQAFFCRAGINIASVLSNGTITGCSNNHESFYEGNILSDNFVHLWEDGFQKFRKRIWLENTICTDCEYFKKCNGNSIHLWELPSDRPKFCYVKDLSLLRN